MSLQLHICACCIFVHYVVLCLSPISRVPHMFPNYIRAPNGAEAKPVSQLYVGKLIIFTERQKQQQIY